MNLCVFAPVFFAVTYFFIYVLLPNTIQKKKYLLFITGFLLAYIIGTAINYFTAGIFLAVTGYFPNTFQHRIEMGNFNTRWAMIIATIALGIKLGKNWYQQQKENLELVKRRSRTEIQLEKARIHPELLLRSLDTIYENIQSCSDKTPSLILNLSEVLSYSLYENISGKASLKNELLQLQHLVDLEQAKKEKRICVEMYAKGDMNNKFIAPMVLVKMLEQIITHLHNANIFSCFAQLQMIVEGNTLFATLFLRDEDDNALSTINLSLFIENTRNRLSNYYAPSDFHIDLIKHTNEINISLQLKLLEDMEAENFALNNKKSHFYDNR